MTDAGWEHFHHVADIGVRGYGATEEEAFSQAAMALTAVIADPASVSPQKAITIECAAPDRELLLVDWLNAIIYEMATRSMLFSRFTVQLSGEHLNAEVWGEKVAVARHRPAVEVKGATYTALKVAHEGGRWIAQCVVDV